MLQNQKKLLFCPHTFFCEGKSMHIFLAKEASNQAEKAPEKEVTPLPFEANLQYDQLAPNPLNSNIVTLMTTAMREEYRDAISVNILTKINPNLIKDKTKDIRRMQLLNGTIYLMGENGKPLAAFDVSKEMRDVIDDVFADRRGRVYSEQRSDRLYFFVRHVRYSDRYLRLMAQPGYGRVGRRPLRIAGRAAPTSADERLARETEPTKPPLTPQQAKAVLELREMYEKGKRERNDILTTALSPHNPNYDFPMNVDSHIANGNLEQFEEKWPDMDHSEEIDALMEDEPNAEMGYTVNPFKKLKGNTHEILQNLTQHLFNDRIYLKEVLDLVYSDRFDDFKKDLGKMPEEVLDLLHKGDAIKTYRELKEIVEKIDGKDPKQLPKNLQKLVPHLAKIKEVIRVLGDYIAYSTRLVQLVDQLRYNAPGTKAVYDKTMFDRREGTSSQALEANRVIDGLTTLFIENVDLPREYTSEIKYLFTSRKSGRPINFQDLNGNTRTVEPLTEADWFTLYQSPQTAYKFAFEAAEKRVDSPDGSPHTEIDEVSAMKYLNDALQLGITAYPALPADHKRSLKEIIEKLADAMKKEGKEVSKGVPLRFTGNLAVDVRNLYAALAIHDLGGVGKEKTKAEKMIAAERTRFIRIGSVINQKKLAKKQERESQEVEKRTAAIRYSPGHAAEIVAQLRATKKFEEAQLKNFESILIGGGLYVAPDVGGGINLHIPFDNGVSIDIFGSLERWNDVTGVGAGLAVGKRFEVSDNVTIAINAGGGISALAGWGVTAGGRVTRKFSKVDFYVEGGAGLALETMGVGVFLGAGFDWGKFQENYQEKLREGNVKNHIDELSKTGNPYAEVKANPAKYAQLYDIIYKLKNTSLELDEPSMRDAFNGIFDTMKEGVQNVALEKSLPGFLMPTAIGFGVAAPIGEGVPVVIPYLYVTFALWKRKLVYRLATSTKYVAQLGEDLATRKLAESLQKDKESTKVQEKTLKTSAELVFDPQHPEQFMLKSTSGGKIDFSFMERGPGQFELMRKELADNAKIFVDPADREAAGMGLILLSPQKAHGTSNVFIDPKLGQDVMLVTRGSRLYLSVKKDKEVQILRVDTTYPYKRRGEVEQTQILILDPSTTQTFEKAKEADPSLRDVMLNDYLADKSEFYMMRRPTTEWVKKSSIAGRTPKERLEKKQNNIKTWEEFMAWRKTNELTDRLELETYSSQVQTYNDSYGKLEHSLYRQGQERADFKLGEDLIQKLKEFETPAFIDFYKKHWTLGVDIQRTVKIKKKKGVEEEQIKPEYFKPEWGEHFDEVIKKIHEIVGRSLNEHELDAVLMHIFIASISNQPQKDWENPVFQTKLKMVFTPLLTALFCKRYEGRTDKDAIVKAAVDFTLEALKDANMNQAEAVPEGTLFGTIVGTYDEKKEQHVNGVRRFFNFKDDGATFGVLGKRLLDVTKKDTEGEVGRFWLESLSYYQIGIHNKPLPAPTAPEYRQYQNQMYANLHTPMAMKLVELVAVEMTPEEIEQLAHLYEPTPQHPDITEENIGVVKKLLDECDKARTAELEGKKEFRLNDNRFLVRIGWSEKDAHGKEKEFHHIGVQVSHGIFKKCGNVSGLVTEDFQLIYLGEKPKKRNIHAGMGEVVHDVKQYMGARVFQINIGAALPIPIPKEIVPEIGVTRPDHPTQPKPDIPTAREVPPPTTRTQGKVNTGKKGSTGEE